MRDKFQVTLLGKEKDLNTIQNGIGTPPNGGPITTIGMPDILRPGTLLPGHLGVGLPLRGRPHGRGGTGSLVPGLSNGWRHLSTLHRRRQLRHREIRWLTGGTLMAKRMNPWMLTHAQPGLGNTFA